ncbi:hypothetical protein [Modestobacter sp. SSW1-42]|uniref:hypothetical protein n=1 Tax=Modestobacter sp. SSW1-42 TaxID=596372 RepID=UPI003985AF60
MNADATVRTADLEAALDYLEGLVTILRTFHADQRGREDRDELLAQLQALEGLGMKWEPLRYQEGVGQGWESVAQNVAELRERLLGPYTEAAL